MARQDPPASCPCGSNRRYPDCCGRFHAGPQHLLAPDAEALMRSRYSAYVLGLTDYLLQTWHPSTRPNGLPADPAGLKWLGLSVRRHERLDDTHARVSFVARSRLDGRGRRMEETSRFVREGRRWYYVDACESTPS